MPDLEQYRGREQGFVKHALIKKYLEDFAIKIGRRWDKIVYLDAFAGPWENVAEDLSDTSFCIALKKLKSGVEVAKNNFGRKVKVQAYLIEKNKDAFQKLQKFGHDQSGQDFSVTCYNGSFEDQIKNIHSEFLRDKTNSFLFALIDPKGWSGLSMDVMGPLLRQRPVEVLVNVMTSFIGRFTDVENCQLSYEKFFGRPGVQQIIASAPSEERADVVVREYCRSLRQICGFNYVSSAVVFQPDKRGIKYFMVYGTNSPMGVKVFKKAEAYATSVQDQIKEELEFGGPSLFSGEETLSVSYPLRRKYRKAAFERVLELFKDNAELPYDRVFCKAMAMPLVTEEELLQDIENHQNLEIKLGGQRRKKPSIDPKKNDRVLWVVR